MAVKNEDRLKLMDYVQFKSDSTSIYQVIFINYLDDRISLKLIYPNLPAEYKVGSYSLSKSNLIILKKTGIVSTLYDT
jgi:hypothetical protein